MNKKYIVEVLALPDFDCTLIAGNYNENHTTGTVLDKWVSELKLGVQKISR